MGADLYSLKIASEKVEMIEDTLTLLDETIILVSAFTQTKENQVLLSKLLENVDAVKTIVSSVDLMETTTEDINKGTYLGNRKTDIDIALNKQGIAEATSNGDVMAVWNNTANTVYYNKAICTFIDGTSITVPFINDDAQSIQISTHGSIVDQLNNNMAFTTKLEDTVIVEEAGGSTATFIRIADVAGKSSNVERIELNAVSGAFVNSAPIYYWAKTTSSLQTIANRIGDIIALGNDIDSIIILSSRINEFLELQANLPELSAIHTELTKLVELHTNLDEILLVDENAVIVTNKLEEVVNIRDSIHSITARAISGSSSAVASATFDSTNNEIVLVIPEGKKGDKGEPFQVNAMGLLSQRSIYVDRTTNFSFLARDEGKIYFKVSDTLDDWSLGVPFGKGDIGNSGENGNGIVGIRKTNTVANVDTYTITFTDTSTYNFTVTNTSVTQNDLDEQTATLGDLMWKQSLVNNNLKIEGVA